MPVSRKRKKNRKSAAKPRPTPVVGGQRVWPGGPTRAQAVEALAGLNAQRERTVAQREATATASGDEIVADLLAYAAAHADGDVERELCARLGEHLRRWRALPIVEATSSDSLVDAVITAAIAAVRETLTADASASWQVLVAVAGVVPASAADALGEAIDELRGLPGGAALPALPAGPAVAGPVRWVRDGYGSRFGVIAPVATDGRPVRWYLWDVDACAHNPMTVYAGYHDSAELALADWQAAVGLVAAGAATLTDVDDPELMAELLEREYDYRAGPASQLEEHIRSRRLADVACESLQAHPAGSVDVLHGDSAAAEFTAWLAEHRPELAATDGVAELAQELAASWFFGEPQALLGTCSPHRVAHAVLHLHNYYQDDFATELMTLMPDWVAWLSERNGTPPELAARCRPYALGEPHADVGADNSRPVMDARVIE